MAKSLNPYLQDLVCLSTRKVASSKVQDDLLRAKDVGEELYKAFREQCLECDPLKVKFHDTKKKAKLKIFTDLNSKIKVKASNNQEVVLKAEKRLFAPMITIAEYRNLQMSEFLAHPLGPLPWKLTNPDGKLRKTYKASFCKGNPKELMYKSQMLFPNHQHRWHGFSLASKGWPENIC